MLICIFNLPSWADKPSVNKVDDFFKTPPIVNAVPSPSGKHIALLARGSGGRVVLATLNANELQAPKMLAGFASIDVSHVDWINEERLVYVTYDLSGNSINSNRSVFAVNRDGSKRVQLISGNWDYQQESTGSNIKRRILPANYSLAAVVGDGSDDVIVSAWKYNNIDLYPESRLLYRLNSKSLALDDMLEGPQPEKMLDWWLDTENKLRVAATNSKGRYRVYFREPASSEWRQLDDFNALANEGFIPLVLEGSSQMIVQKANERGFDALYRYDLTRNSLSKEPLLEISGFDFEGEPILDRSSRGVLGFHFKGDADSTVWLNAKMKAIQAKIDAKLPSTINQISCINCLSSESYVVRTSSDRQPSVFMLYRPENDELKVIGSARPEIDPNQMGQRDFHHFTARDGMKIPAYVTLPPGAGKGPHPTVILVHGGPYIRGGSWEWEAEAQFLASRGYAVIQPEFRGSTGFGFAHFQAGWRQWGLGMQDDLADAAKWAVKQGWADEKRIALAGASYGGYATLMGLIKHPEIFRCGVEWAGVTDINLMFSVSWSDASQQQLRYGMPVLIGDPIKDAEQFRATSPLENAERLKQPLLMAYGGADLRVPLVHGTKFHDAVKRHNANVEWVVYQDEGHGWMQEKNRIDFWERVERFLDKHLKHPSPSSD